MGRPASQELKTYPGENPRYQRELFGMIWAMFDRQGEAAEILGVNEPALSQMKNGTVPAKPHWKSMMMHVASNKPEVLWSVITEPSPQLNENHEPEPEWAAEVLAAVNSVRSEDRDKFVSLIRGLSGLCAREAASYRKRGAA
jgi:hypothetical protein